MNIIIVLDAREHAGLGHYMRCKTLGNKFISYGASVEFHFTGSGLAKKEIIESDAKVFNSPFFDFLNESTLNEYCNHLIKVNHDNKIDFIIVDGYQFNKLISQLRIKLPQACIVTLIDSPELIHRDANLSFCPAYFNSHKQFSNHIYFGPDYAICSANSIIQRDESLRRRKNKNYAIDSIVIFLSTVSEFRDIQKILNALSLSFLRDVKIDCFAEGFTEEEYALLQQFNLPLLNLHRHFCKNITTYLAKSDFAFLGLGSITWDKCTLGLPSISFYTGPNQENNNSLLSLRGAHLLGGESYNIDVASLQHLISGLVDSKILMDLSIASSEICDGNGPMRIFSKMREFFSRN